jgi:hypothetical protein
MTLMSSLIVSPDRHRRLHRTIEGGIGFCARQFPLAYSKKSVHGSIDRFISPSSTPFPADPPLLALPVPALEEAMSCAETNAALNTKKTKARIGMENLE